MIQGPAGDSYRACMNSVLQELQHRFIHKNNLVPCAEPLEQVYVQSILPGLKYLRVLEQKVLDVAG